MGFETQVMANPAGSSLTVTFLSVTPSWWRSHQNNLAKRNNCLLPA